MIVTNTPSTTVLATSAMRKRRRPGRTALIVLNYALPLIVLVAIWQLATTLADNKFFPPPSVIVEVFVRLFFSGPATSLFLTEQITVDTWGTLSRLILGFVAGSVSGILIGMAIGRSMVVRGLTTPLVEFLRSVPATATLPLFIILLGGADGMRIAFIAYGVSWFVIINTAAGVSSVHITQIEMGQIFKLSRAAVLLRIILPAAMPKIFAGLRIAIIAGIMLAIASEFLLASNGIGYQLSVALANFKFRDMWAWMLLLALIGLIINLLLELIEYYVLRWDRLAQSAG